MSKFRCFLLFLLFIVCSFAVSAQSTIFNIPSTDVVQDGRFYVEADFISHLDRYRNGGYQTYAYRTVYGLKRKVEVGGNFFYTRGGKGASPKEFQPTIKWKPFESEKYGLAASTGAVVFVPLNKSAGRRSYVMFYANGSKTFTKIRGMRFTAGYYRFAGTERGFGAKSGAIVGVEQPIRKRLSFIADWSSGNNRLGYTAVGFNYAFTKRQFIFLGYNFGNTGAGNNAFSAFYGYTF